MTNLRRGVRVQGERLAAVWIVLENLLFTRGNEGNAPLSFKLRGAEQVGRKLRVGRGTG